MAEAQPTTQQHVQTTFEGDGFVRQIMEQGYVEMPHYISEDQIAAAVEAYARFTLSYPDPDPSTMRAMLPDDLEVDDATGECKQLDELDRSRDEQLEWHKYRTNTAGIGKPDGYTNRSFQVSALQRAEGLVLVDDPKEYFHYTRGWLAAVNRSHNEFGWGAVPPEVAVLETRFRNIHQKSAELIIRIAGLIEETHPEIRSFFTQESLASSPIRLLFYHPTATQQESLAAGHYDKGAFTLQLAESHQGLRIAANNKALEPVVRTSDLAAGFPARNLRDTVGQDTPYQPSWHDVTRTDIPNHGRSIPSSAADRCARWALIFFANGDSFRNPDKALTHTR